MGRQVIVGCANKNPLQSTLYGGAWVRIASSVQLIVFSFNLHRLQVSSFFDPIPHSPLPTPDHHFNGGRRLDLA
jgi:hypothetical protein